MSDDFIPVVHVIQGLQGAGKSTLARELAATSGAVHVELDAVRRRVWPDAPREWDPYRGRGLTVQRAFEDELLAWVLAGRDVISDRTNLTAVGRARLELLLAGAADIVEHSLLHVPVETCIARDAARSPETRVGADVITRTYWRYLTKETT